MIEFLNSVFGSFDKTIINSLLSLEQSAGAFFTPLAKIITLLGEKGLIFFGASIILMLFTKTRRLGICMFGAVACGALITNVILKDTICRIRPCHDQYALEYSLLNFPDEDGFSFPSGHMTAISSAMFALFLCANKKTSWIGLPFILVMGFARVYLLAHYPSDVIAGIVVGLISSIIAYFITKLIYFLLNKYKDNKFCNFVLNKGIILKKKNSENKESE